MNSHTVNLATNITRTKFCSNIVFISEGSEAHKLHQTCLLIFVCNKHVQGVNSSCLVQERCEPPPFQGFTCMPIFWVALRISWLGTFIVQIMLDQHRHLEHFKKEMAKDLGMTPHLKSSIKRKPGLDVCLVSTKVTTGTKIHLS